MGGRLTFWRPWVRIPAPYTGWIWHFFTFICCKNWIVCLKRPKINEKEAGLTHFLTLISSGDFQLNNPASILFHIKVLQVQQHRLGVKWKNIKWLFCEQHFLLIGPAHQCSTSDNPAPDYHAFPRILPEKVKFLRQGLNWFCPECGAKCRERKKVWKIV